MPGLIQSIHANGVVWLGYNAVNAQAGDLREYDGGEGWTCGVAFGNGEDVKRFIELVYVVSGRHEYRDPSTTPSVVADATQSQFYLGGRRYLLPVTGKRSRAAPFVAGGLVWNNLAVAWESTPLTGTEYSSVYGLGFYAGTGIELYLSTQLALCLDVRASYWNWEGIPVNTGYQSNAGGNLLLVYHF